MNEWQDALKIGLSCLLIIGLVAAAIVFAVTGEGVKEVTVDRLARASDVTEELYKFNGTYLDKQSAFNFACSCIDKPVVLKINSVNKGVKQINLNSSKVHKDIEVLIDRDRFKVIVTENSGKLTVSLEG